MNEILYHDICVFNETRVTLSWIFASLWCLYYSLKKKLLKHLVAVTPCFSNVKNPKVCNFRPTIVPICNASTKVGNNSWYIWTFIWFYYKKVGMKEHLLYWVPTKLYERASRVRIATSLTHIRVRGICKKVKSSYILTKANFHFRGPRLFLFGGPSGRYVIQISTTRARYIQWTSCSNS